MYLGPHIAGHLGQMGVSQLALNGPISKFLNKIYTKSKLKEGRFFEKNCQLMYFGPPLKKNMNVSLHFEKILFLNVKK